MPLTYFIASRCKWAFSYLLCVKMYGGALKKVEAYGLNYRM